jgi:hypothetical protein
MKYADKPTTVTDIDITAPLKFSIRLFLFSHFSPSMIKLFEGHHYNKFCKAPDHIRPEAVTDSARIRPET